MRPSLAVEALRDAIVEIVRRHRGLNPRVFGSAARGDDREDSDLDLLVDPAPGMTLFDVGGIIDEVETLLGVPVDVLTPGALRAGMFESVMQALRPV
jgi:predicted nucleotidyltransferase